MAKRLGTYIEENLTNLRQALQEVIIQNESFKDETDHKLQQQMDTVSLTADKVNHLNRSHKQLKDDTRDFSVLLKSLEDEVTRRTQETADRVTKAEITEKRLQDQLNHVEHLLKSTIKNSEQAINSLKEEYEANIGSKVKQDKEYQQSLAIYQRLERIEEVIDLKFPNLESGKNSHQSTIRGMINKQMNINQNIITNRSKFKPSERSEVSSPDKIKVSNMLMSPDHRMKTIDLTQTPIPENMESYNLSIKEKKNINS